MLSLDSCSRVTIGLRHLSTYELKELMPLMQEPAHPQGAPFDEIERLRKRIAELEAIEAGYCQADKLLRVLEKDVAPTLPRSLAE